MPVAQSSHVQHYEHDERTNSLYVEFTNGAQYRYDNVPVDVFNRWRETGGSGSFFHARIKGQYAESKLAEGYNTGRRRR